MLPEWVYERVRSINATLRANAADGFQFDPTHLPHVTLLQQFVWRSHLPTLKRALYAILSAAAPLRLRAAGVGKGEHTLHLLLEPTPDLQALHERLMDAGRRTAEPAGGAEAFYSEGEPARARDVRWVAEYCVQAAYSKFWPHITLGVGQETDPVEPFDCTATRVALCHLGRFCTCRVILGEWTLQAGA